ncbi:RES family NAD+ phosphorylase [Jannaschia rubra]|uniref:RES domain protein n=1 Tax=Jannaschia rubra TaxID=282197 RepID=A0A0M6XUH0_9RHOB|nr:RES family NAD+ phosphorylase [Jannaschia rubra]CTQ34799.1 RES domain protein [Jannaschia rubra]SFG80604.1 RES domain-containing protein [Jannaschia rubra]
MTEAVPRRVTWARTHRIVRTLHPPIDLFEDIADPVDWEALASAAGKTDPAAMQAAGRLDLVPAARRVGGPGASHLMAPFVHCSPDRPGRFSDGSYGVYYAGDATEVALREVAHHHGVFLRATAEAPGWTGQFRELLGSVDAVLHDVGPAPGVLDPVDYAAAQALAARLRAGGSDGVVYPSVRAPGGMCIAVFWPDVLPVPVQGDPFEFHFDGAAVDRVRNRRTAEIWAV